MVVGWAFGAESGGAPRAVAGPRDAAPAPYSRCVARLTPEQVRKRERVETVIGIAAPVLDLVLVVGERLSRLVQRDDPEYHPQRTGREPSPPEDRA